MDDINTMSAFAGILISLGWEQTDYFKDTSRSAVSKILIVLGTCVAWSLVVWFMTIDQFPTTLLGWRSVLVTAVVTAFSSQAFHNTVNNYLPSAATWISSLRTTTTLSSATVTTGSAATIGYTASLQPVAKYPDGTLVYPVGSTTTNVTAEKVDSPMGKTPALGTPALPSDDVKG